MRLSFSIDSITVSPHRLRCGISDNVVGIKVRDGFVMCNTGETRRLHIKELVKYQFERRLCCMSMISPFNRPRLLFENQRIKSVKSLIPLMALPRKVAVRFAHVHNTPSSRTLSV